MTQTTALIVHELMDSPEKFTDRGNGTVSNGYYMVALDGSRFGMGTASYQADGAQREMLTKAVSAWKAETGWVAPESSGNSDSASGESRRGRISPEVFMREAYETFSRQIRNHHRSFMMHKDATVLSNGIQNAIMTLDTILKPVEAIEGRKKSSEPLGGTSGS